MRVVPSTVTCCSAIASSSADWAFGNARFTSSTSSTFAKTGPARNSKVRVCGFQMERPVMSVGCRSGVHWMRETTAPSMLPAIVRASTVFAVPGTSSSSTWPRQASAATTSAICSDLPTTTVSTFARSRAATSCACTSPSTREIVRTDGRFGGGRVVTPRNIRARRRPGRRRDGSINIQGRGMMRLFRMVVPVALAGVLVALAVASTTGAKSVAVAPAPPFTPQDLNLPAAGDWLTVGGGLQDQRLTTLTQVTPANVTSLHLAWTGTFNLPKAAAAVPEEGAALAYKGTLYMPNGLNQMQAVDGASCKALWTYQPVNFVPALLPALPGLAL